MTAESDAIIALQVTNVALLNAINVSQSVTAAMYDIPFTIMATNIISTNTRQVAHLTGGH